MPLAAWRAISASETTSRSQETLISRVCAKRNEGRRLIDALFPQLIHGYFGFSIPVSGQRKIAVESEAEDNVSHTIATRIRVVE